MKTILAICILASCAGSACAQAPARKQCFEGCEQEMKACYRINDVIFIDHCDQEYKRCSAACARRP